jgi:protein-tyrosine phosphatase
MTKVLMVCLGNICRSPLAEGVLKDLVQKRGLENNFFIDSAGTIDFHAGDLPDPRARQTAENHGFTLQHRGRQFGREDFSKFDFILVMDESNYRDVMSLAKSDEQKAKVHYLSEFEVSKKYGKIVPDPYYGDLTNFEQVYEQLSSALTQFISQISQK